MRLFFKNKYYFFKNWVLRLLVQFTAIGGSRLKLAPAKVCVWGDCRILSYVPADKQGLSISEMFC